MSLAAEFILDPTKSTIIVVKPYGPSFGTFIEKMQSDATVQVVECESSFEAVPLAKQVGKCIILGFVAASDHVVKHITMLKLLQEEIAAKKIRVMLTTSIKEQALVEKLHLYNVYEIVREPISDKSLIFKISNLVKALVKTATKTKTKTKEKKATDAKAAGAKAEASQKEKNGTLASNALSGTPTEGGLLVSGSAARPTFRMIEPLSLQSDFWLVRGGNVRRVGERWMIKLRGVGPLAGRWVVKVVEDTEGNDARTWIWTPSDSDNDPFIKEQGAWIFKGQRAPEALDEIWSFVGQAPSLEFYYDNESYGAKFKCDRDGTMSVAADSAQAIQSVVKLQETWNKTIREDRKRSLDEELDEKNKNKSKNKSQESSGDNPDDSSESESRSSAVNEVKMFPALTLESDCWIYEKAGAKRAGEYWMIRLEGPGRKTGKWVQVVGEQEEPSWQWVPVDPENDPFTKEQGAWICRGNVPQYVGNSWIFSGKKPRLDFVYEGESYGNKFSVTEPRQMEVSENSRQALAKRQLIEASVTQEVTIKNATRSLDSAREDEEDKTFSSTEAGADEGDGDHRRKIFLNQSDVPTLVFFKRAHVPFCPKEASPESVLKEKPIALDYLDKQVESNGQDINDKRTEDEAAKAWNDQVEPEEKSEKSFPEIIQERLKSKDLELPPGTAEALREAANFIDSGPPAGPALSGLALIRAERPPGPSLSPLALAFLVSELMTKKSHSTQQLAKRFCEYLEASCGGLHVEMWLIRPGVTDWKCAAVSHGEEPRAKTVITGRVLKPGAELVDSKFLITPIGSEGALVIFGSGVELVDHGYLENVAAIGTGLVQSLSQVMFEYMEKAAA